MICYKCDMCGDIHYAIGEMYNVKISYAGKANVSLINGGEYMICNNCETKLVNILNFTNHEVEKLKNDNQRI